MLHQMTNISKNFLAGFAWDKYTVPETIQKKKDNYKEEAFKKIANSYNGHKQVSGIKQMGDTKLHIYLTQTIYYRF